MLCAISGETPQEPVASRKSGTVYEKRLIEAYISENGTDPVNGEDLTVEDLLPLSTPRAIRARPPTVASIPNLLTTFQSEWDSIAMETFALQQNLSKTKQELSAALYQCDAMRRVIQKLQQERDEAKDALSKITVGTAQNGHGDAMEIEGAELPEPIAEVVANTHKNLSSTRRKRPVPEGWATPDVIEALAPTFSSEPLYPGSKCLAVDESGEVALFGGSEGIASILSIADQKEMGTIKCNSAITAAVWSKQRAIVATAAGEVKVFETGAEIANLGSHAGAVTGLSLHASGTLLASVGVDKSYKVYDLTAMKMLVQNYTESEITCGGFHPDGHLFAAGGKSGNITIFDVASGTMAAEFQAEGALHAMSFSENGTWLATISKGDGTVSVWDLRKSVILKTIDVGGELEGLQWDYTGKYLAVAGPECVAVQMYDKSSKSWSEPLRKAVPAAAVAWGAKAQSLVALTKEGSLTVLAA
ncbi:WD40 repeat-like protein [Aulographum hederae CBS 113979]|uniref:Pre-mRNA-processing factor 19 n=1 Tax=Aulographum hederae CBS 113979 TaxID=1176131 RepID=A0A6G1H9R8_9PEZI|nr:WD40 repeat-like protein [Aulographum hederae CBS 113979]